MQDRETLKATTDYLEVYAKEGLRTLLLVEKEISQEEYSDFLTKYKEASLSQSMREERMEAVADKLERNFELLGATAIEDKLQENVDETIHFMKEAGIKVWVLTGDKIETAINIGYSCKLLNEDMEKYVIDGDSRPICADQLF